MTSHDFSFFMPRILPGGHSWADRRAHVVPEAWVCWARRWAGLQVLAAFLGCAELDVGLEVWPWEYVKLWFSFLSPVGGLSRAPRGPDSGSQPEPYPTVRRLGNDHLHCVWLV